MNLSFVQAIAAAQGEVLADPRVHLIGLGATYKNGIDGTSGNLAEKFPMQVHDTPCSEAGITGMCVGMAISGLRPIIHHGRVEFALFAADQILTQAAKWNYMFDGYPCPMVVRVAIGRHHGHGPQHTQVARGLFAIPGLKVVVPSTPAMAAGLLVAAVFDPNPVVFLEHRWLYKLKQAVPPGHVERLSTAKVLRQGAEVTIVALADMVVEALRAAKQLATVGIEAEVIDLVSINPIDYDTVLASIRRTRGLVIADVSTPGFDACAQLSAEMMERAWSDLRCPPWRVNAKTAPCPTATSLSGFYYPTSRDIVEAVGEILGRDLKHLCPERSFAELHLPPTDNMDDLINV